jgi:hypothetical protein
MLVQLAVGAILTAAQPAAPDLNTCRGGPSMSANVDAAHQAYAARSVAIVNAALARDVAALQAMVSRNARYRVMRGDAGYWSQQDGPNGAIQLFGRLAPTDYQFSTAFGWPLSQILCAGDTVELVLTGGEEAAVLKFRYEGPLLFSVTGNIVSVTRGQLNRPPVD